MTIEEGAKKIKELITEWPEVTCTHSYRVTRSSFWFRYDQYHIDVFSYTTKIAEVFRNDDGKNYYKVLYPYHGGTRTTQRVLYNIYRVLGLDKEVAEPGIIFLLK